MACQPYVTEDVIFITDGDDDDDDECFHYHPGILKGSKNDTRTV